MPTTPIYGLRYQALTDSPNGATLGQNLATDVEAQVVRLDGLIATNTTNIAAINAAEATNPDVQVFTGSGTWTKPADAVRVQVKVVGGGGGGGGAAATTAGNSASAAGGGGGGYSEEIQAAGNYTASVVVTVGAGGAAGSAGVNTGGTGGTSSFEAYLQATGGVGGTGCGSGQNAVVAGGAGGVGSSGQINLTGQTGCVGRISAGGVALGSYGGSSQLGGGAPPALNVNTDTGVAGTLYGGGGSGAINRDTGGTGAKAGGAGAAGVVIVTTWFS